MKTHHLKCWLEPYAAVSKGDKRYEFRKNDRGFMLGDRLVLHEYDQSKGEMTGNFSTWYVTYITQGPAFGVPVGYCVMSIALFPRE